MGWILQGLSEVIVSLLGDILTFLLKCFADFDLDIGYNKNSTSWGELFSLSYYKNANGLLDGIFSDASKFFTLFMYLGFEMVVVITITKIILSLINPDTKSAENPLMTAGKAVIAGIGVVYSYSIFIMIEMAANTVYQGFKEQFNSIKKANKLPGLTDYLTEPNDFFKDVISESNLLLFFLEIGLFVALIFQFLKLLLEAFERYIVLGFLFYSCPLAFSTIVVGKESEIFFKWIQMLIATYICIFSNLFFIGVFYAGFHGIFTPKGGKSWLFVDGSDFIIKMCILIAWLTVGQKVDEILRSLGISAAKTGAGLGTVAGSALAAGYKAARSTLGMIGSGASMAEALRSGAREAAENDAARSAAESVLAGAGDAHDTMRAATTSSEIQANMAGTSAAFTSDIIGSDGVRPTYGDTDTRESMSEMGVDIPSYGNATMSDGKVSVADDNGNVISEVGDARRWEAAGGGAMFTQNTESGTVVRAATQEDISSATTNMISSLESNSMVSDGITWESYTDEHGNDTGLAIGYNSNDEAVYAAYVDGACSMNSDYGRVHEYQTPQGETRRMSGIEIPHSNGATYRVQGLQDAEHQTKHFGSVQNFTQNGVKFNAAASSHELTKKSVGAQNAYSFAHAPNQQRWKASYDTKAREINNAERTMRRTDPKFESKNAKRSRFVGKFKS